MSEKLSRTRRHDFTKAELKLPLVTAYELAEDVWLLLEDFVEDQLERDGSRPSPGSMNLLRKRLAALTEQVSRIQEKEAT